MDIIVREKLIPALDKEFRKDLMYNKVSVVNILPSTPIYDENLNIIGNIYDRKYLFKMHIYIPITDEGIPDKDKDISVKFNPISPHIKSRLIEILNSIVTNHYLWSGNNNQMIKIAYIPKYVKNKLIPVYVNSDNQFPYLYINIHTNNIISSKNISEISPRFKKIWDIIKKYNEYAAYNIFTRNVIIKIKEFNIKKYDFIELLNTIDGARNIYPIGIDKFIFKYKYDKKYEDIIYVDGYEHKKKYITDINKYISFIYPADKI